MSVTVTSVKPILLVEDDPDDERLCVRALKQSQLVNPVVVARDGQEALDYLFGSDDGSREPAERPHVILLDLKLPKVDGFEVLRRIRTDPRTETLPVVILTGSKEDRDIVKGYGLRANSYVVKPITFEEFIEVVQQLKLYWLVLNQSPPT